MYIKGQNFEFNYGVLNFKKGMKSEGMRVVEAKMKKKDKPRWNEDANRIF